LKILIYSSIIPYPLSEGGKTAQFFLLKEMLSQGDIHFVAPVYNLKDAKCLQALNEALPSLKVHVLSVDLTFETPKNIFYKILNKLNWHTGKLLKGYLPEKHSVLDNPFFTNPVRRKPKELIQAFGKLVSAIKPDIFQVDFIDNADMALMVPSTCKKVLVMHDLRYVTVEQASILNNFELSCTQYLVNLVKQREIPFLHLYDAVFVFSESDKERLEKEGVGNLHVTPFGVNMPLSHAIPDLLKFNKIVFLGPEHHMPNSDALKWFVEFCYPILYPEFKLPLEVVGIWSDKTMKEYVKYPNIHFLGYVENIKNVLKDAILIVPLRMGSGIRTKILDAFFWGVPVVTTPLGVEGIPVKNEEHCLIANNPSDFVSQLIKLNEQKVDTSSIRTQAFNLAKHHFDPIKMAQLRVDLFKFLMKNKS